MRPRAALIAWCAVLVPLAIAGPGSAGPDAPAHGVTSSLVEHIRFVPFEVYSATGARVVDNYLYLTSWKNLSIYDVSQPEDPKLISFTPFSETDDDGMLDPHRYENEDVATNGEILLFTQHGATPLGGGTERLRIYDVSDKTAPVQIANVPEIAEHTMTCIQDCRYAYGSNPGRIVDLADPSNPVVMGQWPALAGVSGGHDVREVAPGMVAVSSNQAAILDVSDPLHPVRLAVAGSGSPRPAHSSWWDGSDRFLLGAEKTSFTVPRCSDVAATSVWDMSDYRSGYYELASRYSAESGWLFDGNPPASALGCSSHWLEASPSFEDGGIFAQAHYEHGVRFFAVSGSGAVTEVGFFTPAAGSVSAVHWITDRILYTIDYTRGIDVIRWNGPLPRRPAAATGISELAVSPGGEVTGSATFAGETAPTVVATDPSGDGPMIADASAAAGIDLVRADVWQSNAAWPSLEFRWEVDDLPSPETAPGSVPEVLRYSWGFTVDDERYLLSAKLSNQAGTTSTDDPAGPAAHVGRAFELLGDCQAPAPEAGPVCRHLAWLDGAFDVTEEMVSIMVPVGAPYAPDIAPGAVLETTQTVTDAAPSIAAAYHVVVTGHGTSAGGTTVGSMADGTTWSSYTIPAGIVRLGVAPSGSDPAEVTYDREAEVRADGSYRADLGAIPAGWRVYAQACFGSTCGGTASAAS